jgi:drug/metabolite transporter (DMT)-like permease
VPTSALLLALAAAFVHALWNLLLARARDPESATALALVVAVVVFAPVAAVAWDVDAGVWPYVVGSSVFELVYFALLAAAYRRAELSVVYPLARGTAPVLVLIVGVAVLGAATSVTQAVGVLVVGAGVLTVRGIRRPAAAGGVVFALSIAVCIAAYTLIDSEGVQLANALAYLELSMVVPSIVYMVAIVRLKGREAVRSELKSSTVVAGLAMWGAYALVLLALQRAPAAPVAAVRETSVVIATALAATVLGERVTRTRLAGALVVAAGVALIVL